MRVLFISSADMMAGNLAYVMKNEGHDVKLFIDNEDRKENFDNMVPKTSDWRSELKWVGKDGLIVFDDVGYGATQEELRTEGYSVFGGNKLGDKLEMDRQYAQEIFAGCGIKTVPIKNFRSIPDAIAFIKSNKDAWVIKQNGASSKSLNYVSHFDDSRDVVNLMENYNANLKGEIRTITLQQKIKGVEIGVARYFNGTDWVGPMEINIEHKKFFPGDLGPATSEMGTLAWYDDNENNQLFQETLAKLKPHLQKINYRGDVDIGCIVNETGAYPLEATPRFGSPAIYLHEEIHKSRWGEFLRAIADGKKYNLRWQRGYGVVVLLTVPPFPYTKKLKEMSPKGINIYFDPKLKQSEFKKHIHFEGVALKELGGRKQYYISDYQGYVVYVTAVGKTVKSARKKIEDLIRYIYIPKMFYRQDIGINFIEEARHRLKWWGYL